MTAQAMGIPYFGVDVGICRDPKVFELMFEFADEGEGGYDSDAAYAAFGRLVDLLGRIYEEGFALRMDGQRRLMTARQLGLGRDGLDAFLGRCVAAGIFDAGLWERERVLTSAGIQRRYFAAVRRRKASVPEEMRGWLLIDDLPTSCLQPVGSGGGVCGHGADMMPTPCGQDVGKVAAEVGNPPTGSGQNPPTAPTGCGQDVGEKTHRSKSKSKSKKKEKERKDGEDGDDPRVGRIVARLNERTGKRFRASSASTSGPIEARLAEGWTERDCLSVVDAMCDEWLPRPDMVRYLRPETLFRASKFEGYLNARGGGRREEPGEYSGLW